MERIVSRPLYEASFVIVVAALLSAAIFFSSPVAANAGEDVLRLLIWEGYAPPQYVEAFERYIESKYDRKVKLHVSTIEGPEDFYGPVRLKKVDVVTITHHHFKDERFNYISGNMLLPIETRKLSNFQNVIPALRQADYLMRDGKTFGVPICQGPYGLAYSTEKIGLAPESWKSLWDPQYRDKYVIGGNEYLYNVSMAALAWNYPRHAINSYDALNNEEFREKLRQLATNAHSFWIGQDSVEDLSGQSLAAVWGDSLGRLRRRGETWKVAEPAEGTLYWVDNYAITWALAEKPFLRKVAEEWINRMLQPDYQVEYIVRELALGPVTTNIGDRLTSEEKERWHIGIPIFARGNRILLPAYSRRDRNGLKLLWKEAMEGVRIGRGDD